MAAGAADVAIAGGSGVGDEGVDDVAGLIRGKQPVAGEAEHEPAAAALFERGGQFGGRAAEVEQVHRQGQSHVAVGVEALDELGALVAEVRADGEGLFKFDGHVARLEAVGFELLCHRLAGQIGDVTDHAREGEADVGSVGLVVVLAAVEIRVAEDGIAADDVEGEAWLARRGEVASRTVPRTRSG